MKTSLSIFLVLISPLAWSVENNKYPCRTFIQVPLYDKTVEIYYSGFNPYDQSNMEKEGITTYKEAEKYYLRGLKEFGNTKENIDKNRNRILENDRVQLRYSMQTHGTRSDVTNWYQQRVALASCYASYGYPQDVPFHRCSFAPKGKYEGQMGNECQPI